MMQVAGAVITAHSVAVVASPSLRGGQSEWARGRAMFINTPPPTLVNGQSSWPTARELALAEGGAVIG